MPSPAASLKDIVVSDPEVMGGVPCFRGTRIPASTLFENLADGMSLDDIFEQWPTLDPEDVRIVLAEAGRYVERSAA